jgi:hypothetical protein
MRRWLTLVGWIALLAILPACTTNEPRDNKDQPRVGVIGHGTTPGRSWAGVGITIPFPGKQASPPQDSEESTKSKTEN